MKRTVYFLYLYIYIKEVERGRRRQREDGLMGRGAQGEGRRLDPAVMPDLNHHSWDAATCPNLFLLNSRCRLEKLYLAACG